MQSILLILSVFFVKIGPSVLTAKNCKIPFYLMNLPPQCDHKDYCFTLDSERSHSRFFSTKSAYKTESHDRISDFKIDGSYPGLGQFLYNNRYFMGENKIVS